MQGDSIVIEAHHRQAASEIAASLIPALESTTKRHTITIAGESGSGKSETAAALRQALVAAGVSALVLQQDDYFVYPPRSNDAARRRDIAWVGPGEVRLRLMDEHLAAFVDGADRFEKPLVVYERDAVESEIMNCKQARVLIAEGTYTTLLRQADWRVFIARDWQQTRAHREKRRRDESELDPFIDQVLRIEHDIISQHRALADFVIESDYTLSRPERG
ncbi:MAG: hypothetical protein JJU31_15495 [Wenzhouxiangella sp.]|nr:hypothetical protein [Wenzhouxiangella sp.]MCH8478922.1 zeta toxin family protein [Wenzhouxiangella sp.]TVR94338.1 MAG: hypothetical protein EA418_10405 [Wenzhouxiangellaceae bacterium]